MNIQTLKSAVRRIQASDKHWLPPELQGKGVFSSQTIWHYQLEAGVQNCEYCKENANREFLGNSLRSRFPDLVPYDENYIWVNLHQTLWEKPTCKCFLYRAGMSGLNPELVQANPETVFGEYE